jgi:hypothetical protein
MNRYNITNESCQELFMLPWRTTIDIRLRWLQFRINHFILPTNQWLCKIKLIDNSYCMRCKVHVENLDHLFFECDMVKTFWKEFLTIWKHLYSNLSKNDILFGILEKGSDTLKLKNHLLLSAKRYIYNSRCRGFPLSIISFNTVVKDTKRVEEIIAKQQEKLVLHYEKWSPVDDIL